MLGDSHPGKRVSGRVPLRLLIVESASLNSSRIDTAEELEGSKRHIAAWNGMKEFQHRSRMVLAGIPIGAVWVTRLATTFIEENEEPPKYGQESNPTRLFALGACEHGMNKICNLRQFRPSLVKSGGASCN
jgi:hypothetical protein